MPNLGVDLRWGLYGPEAAELGARSCLCEPVVRAGAVLAVVKVYAGRIDAVTGEQRTTAAEFVEEVGSILELAHLLSATARELDDRTTTMNTRRTIDLALGILMERGRCAADTAFGLLKRQSQHTNQALAQVAGTVVAAWDGPVDTTAPFRPARM